MQILSVNRIPSHHMICGHRCFAGGCDGLIEYRVQVSLPSGMVNLCLCRDCMVDATAHPKEFIEHRLGIEAQNEGGKS